MSRHALTIFDELISLDRVAEIRREVLEGGFKTEIGPDGCEYTGISKAQYPELCKAVANALGHDIAVTMSFFRFNTKGDLPHSWVHSDEGCAGHAGILYLNPPEQCEGGTAFWKHEKLGLDEMPTIPELTAAGADVEGFSEMIHREWCVKDAWKMVGLAGMKFGRFITYRSRLFHSRWPFDAFGDKPENSRLIWVCFFDFVAPGTMTAGTPPAIEDSASSNAPVPYPGATA